MSDPAAAPPVLWSPSPERVARAALTPFARWVQETRDVPVTADYHALWRWSVDDVGGFWAAIWEYFDVQHDGSAEPPLGRATMPHAEWFPNAALSFPEHVFRGKDPEALALQHTSELRPLDAWSWGELRERTARIAAGLRALGVGEGDRVVAYLPNLPETVAAFLAVSSLGAIWSSCSPDFGARSVIDRFAQIEPTVLLAVDGYRYGGRDFDRVATLAGLQEELPTVRHTVVLPYLSPAPDLAPLRDATAWDDAFPAGPAAADLTFARVPFRHPLWVLYSSGTTGLPKPIVHGHGGILLELLKKQHLHLDAQADDRVLWFTTTGWMMWNFLVGVLLTEASIVLFDGNPGHPDLGVLWDVAERTGTTTFGTGAAYLAGCLKAGLHPGAGRDLSAIRAVGSTGSPLSPEGFQWVYDELGADTWLFSTSGGTDVCTAFVGGVPTLPVHLGELQAPSLGCKVESWDEDGRPHVGRVGELVLTEPLPSMPVGFWGDEEGSRYRDAYFTYFDVDPPVWRHGDWIELTERGTTIIYGRSDSTINRGGIRMGTSEIYRAVLALDEIVDALVVDVPGREGFPDGWMPLFVVLREGATLDDDLIGRIARRVREDCSPRHVPNEVHAITEVPRTLSGKVLEVPVKRILMGEAPDRAASRDSLANPAALDWFVRLAATL
ncbi:acetoacetate--CoA ligase [Conexibacter sp. W3-3-2]|uniref:acetoacetate--CoA ligase n=1 Tax=Conexibacter sp. W3-3-2 TaxID=2675227 RepID=UPI0012B95DAF|nr:acetoacetate--CoA ligase [Conexibacter sp. W3-3-2]MTD43873.1 acetoacetate--CoA ligase [Conexibacter sp. W3-3-2]